MRLCKRSIALESLHLDVEDVKNAQAAMSRLAGRLALQDALNRYSGLLPKTVSVFGTGPAALGAAYCAHALSLPVQVFGRRQSHQVMIEEAGMTYLILPEQELSEFIQAHVHNQTILVTAVRHIGHPAPVLIDDAVLCVLPDSAVLVDLATNEGGNVVHSQEDATILLSRGISISNVSGYPKAEPQAASAAFSKAVLSLLLYLITPDHRLDAAKLAQLLVKEQ